MPKMHRLCIGGPVNDTAAEKLQCVPQRYPGFEIPGLEIAILCVNTGFQTNFNPGSIEINLCATEFLWCMD